MTTATVLQGDRAKALRPLPRRKRLAALEDARAAWDRGDWFEAHELLEPAWMGTADAAERDLYQGLIKLAAAFVHRERGNALGMAKNLLGARERLARAAGRRQRIEGIDVGHLTQEVDLLLAADNAPSLDAAAPRIERTPVVSSPEGLPTIDVLAASDRLHEASPPMLVDVREPNEYATVRAPGAVLVPLSTFLVRLGELPRDRPLLVMCAVGGRSAAATAHLLASGWSDVTNVAGGIVAWERAGLPVRRGEPAPGEGDLPA